MATMTQIGNVPQDSRHRLEAQAELAGVSLSEYLLRHIREIAERPTREELHARLSRRSEVKLTVDTAEAVRAERGRR